ncbi:MULTISPECIES: phosphatase PAP2 family protein [unclassified Arsukibacterium]|uniref:phosphatase PAP2 family protein n=1 Tax=unclassified Arsukibacterium TaxID=2635278 RepID=UPI000C66B71F|nr:MULTISPECIES: phosphatase PAP2 family protein [unclassified Arsukibacterium]MAA95918.1 PA-phosphatase [Rheinheimera sp.]MBM34778.1 PA-phosphatase [Rheinheimera sp.]
MRNCLAWLGKREKSFWLLLALVTMSLWLFMIIATEVVAGGSFKLDETILLLMRDANNLEDTIGPPWLKQVGQDITALGGNAVLTLASIWVIIFLLLTNKAKLALVVLLATGGALLGSLLLKSGFDRPRPDLVTHATLVYTSSFPSGHSMLAASAYLTMGALLAQSQPRRRVKALIIISSVFLTLLIGVSRVYLGVHWPTDVVAGWAAGSVWAVACSYLARHTTRKPLETDSN